MVRITEKVKDIVEVRSFSKVADLRADPGETLAGYRFTDITADLMGKWLDTIVDSRPGNGGSLALAGFRGVGKTHFLSTLGAIVSKSDLRTRIPDQHVETAAGRLPRRSTTVLTVQRGAEPTLLDELKRAVSECTGVQASNLSDSLNDLLLNALESCGDGPLVMLIDTAAGRETRVARDDGPVLGQIADACRSLGIFIGLALDDDIAGADGANRAISSCFTIDYLDQEHLHKIVDTHIFAKKESSLPLLHDIYKHYHDSLPGFRWSEQRFTSLYPLHPATLEIAPLIRLYLHDFALLGFAAEAGVRIMGRPANSLIGIDEVFDAVEKRLRQVPDITDAFAAFDRLDREIVSKMPVSVRLLAKLVLKGLFILSLDGGCKSANELAAAMLVVEGESGGLDIAALLHSFHDLLPGDIRAKGEDLGEVKFGFKLDFIEDLKTALDSDLPEIDRETVATILLKVTGDKFSDLSLSDSKRVPTSSTTIEWRGSLRHGDIHWDLAAVGERPSNRLADWTVNVRFGDSGIADQTMSERPVINWVLSPLTSDEMNSLRRLHVLQNDVDIRDQFRERAAAETQIQALAVEKAWNRVFLTDGRLFVDQTEILFSEDAAASHTLTQLFSSMLPPVFENRFPEHPQFAVTIGPKEGSQLIANFFGEPGNTDPAVQRLVELFALPLGLAEMGADALVPASAESLNSLRLIRTAFDGVDIAEGNVSNLDTIFERMGASPIGLSREAQHLVLAALVAQRELEFVTSTGNRINHRSLDLQILWDDIVGVTKPFAEVYSSARLLEWARLITGNRQIKSLESSEDRLALIDTMTGWLSNWREARFLEAFDNLPDEDLNSRIWRTASNLKKTFGALASLIEDLVQNAVPVDRCLHHIAELFSDSLEDYESKKQDLIVLRYFTEAARTRRKILSYLSICEITSDADIEILRQDLLVRTGPAFFAAEPSANASLESLWTAFKPKYIDHYLTRHDSAIGSNAISGRFKEIISSDAWVAFQSFSDVEWFDGELSSAATALTRKVRDMRCDADTAAVLERQPFCSCTFRLASFDRRKDGSARLQVIVDQALARFTAKLNDNLDDLKKQVKGETGDTLRNTLANGFEADQLGKLGPFEIVKLRGAIVQLEGSATRNTDRIKGQSGVADLRAIGDDEWENELDNLEVFSSHLT